MFVNTLSINIQVTEDYHGLKSQFVLNIEILISAKFKPIKNFAIVFRYCKQQKMRHHHTSDQRS